MDRNAYKYDLLCIYCMYNTSDWQHPTNINLYVQIDVNVPHQFDANHWRQFDVDSWCYKIFNFLPNVDGQLMLTLDIILMSIQHSLPTGITPTLQTPGRAMSQVHCYINTTLILHANWLLLALHDKAATDF